MAGAMIPEEGNVVTVVGRFEDFNDLEEIVYTDLEITSPSAVPPSPIVLPLGEIGLQLTPYIGMLAIVVDVIVTETFGALALAAMYWLIPRLGIGTTIAMVLCGQLALALVAGHRGWLGQEPVPLTATRALGAIALVAGILLIQKG